MLVRHVALTSVAPEVDLAELMRVGAALQKQVIRDFAPAWRRRATVSAFAQLEDVPLGYWPIVVVDRVARGGGVHLDEDGQPFALVELGPDWSLAASHGCLEMLADPFGNRLVAGASPRKDQGEVEFLVDICDPCEAGDFAYAVNGVMVSDFCTPHFFDPVASGGVRYSFGGHVQKPRQVLPGGYLSWHEPATGEWWQERFFGPSPRVVGLGRMDRARHACAREFVNRGVPEAVEAVRRPPRGPSLAAALEVGRATRATGAKAESWRRQIAGFTKPG
jgi:hypothetical protein